MAGKAYLIGEDFAGKLKTTVSRVLGDVGESQVSSLGLRFEDGAPFARKGFRVCEATGAWTKGEAKECSFLTSTDTFSVVNLLISLPEPKDGGKRVCNAGLHGTAWYLISFEMGTATAVFSSGTAVASVISQSETGVAFTASTTQVVVTDVSTQQQQVMSGVSVSFNTSNCSVVATPSYTNVTAVSGVTKKTITIPAGQQSVVFVKATATMSVAMSTYTATYITLEM